MPHWTACLEFCKIASFEEGTNACLQPIDACYRLIINSCNIIRAKVRRVPDRVPDQVQQTRLEETTQKEGARWSEWFERLLRAGEGALGSWRLLKVAIGKRNREGKDGSPSGCAWLRSTLSVVGVVAGVVGPLNWGSGVRVRKLRWESGASERCGAELKVVFVGEGKRADVREREMEFFESQSGVYEELRMLEVRGPVGS
ncbi:hypothetical protein CRG98_013298 [Punica granatum]|uniref:Uncharacterized protein n=1 Tax=Punica granatum TaxID=22663 RepID=A0A2I0KEU8_PUNGR|nr:hypothetical protein CRG98_013298 [Punica granatum]